MTKSVSAHTSIQNSTAAGAALGEQIVAGLNGASPDAVILFSSACHDYGALLTTLTEACHPKTLVGCSSAGEFTQDANAGTSASAIALHSDDLHFRAGVGRGVKQDRGRAAREVLQQFGGLHGSASLHCYALLLADALAGYTEDLVEQFTVQTAGRYQFFGGGAGDDARFSKTHVFFGTEAISDAVVGLEILSSKPLGIGVGHGWQPATPLLRVTQSESAYVHSLNAIPAAEAYEEYAAESRLPFDAAAPLPFFLHHVIGIRTEQGYKLRVPLAIQADQSLLCAADVPTGATVSIMSIEDTATERAAEKAAQSAMDQLEGRRPAAALFFDCAATRLRMGQDFGLELGKVAGVLGGIPFAGCNTYGQIARADGQFSGFHNCTAVICVIPE